MQKLFLHFTTNVVHFLLMDVEVNINFNARKKSLRSQYVLILVFISRIKTKIVLQSSATRRKNLASIEPSVSSPAPGSQAYFFPSNGPKNDYQITDNL